MPDSPITRVLYVGGDREYFTDLSLVLERAHPSFAVHLESDPERVRDRVDRESTCCIIIESTIDPGWRPLLEAVRERAPDVPVVIATDGDEDCTESAIEAGIDDVLDRREAPTAELAVGIKGAVDRYRTLLAERVDLDWHEALLDGMGDFVVVFGADSAVKYVSPSIEHITGYTPADVEAMGPFGYVHPDDQPDIIDAFYEMMTEPAGAETKVETRAQHADGTWRVHEGIGVNRLGEDPIDGVVVNVRDITDPARPKVLLGEYLDRVTDAFFALDTEQQFTYVNRKAEELLGMDESSLLGQSFDVLFEDPAGGDRFEQQFSRALTSGRTAAFEARYPPTDRWMEVRAYPSETGLSVYFRDITQQRERERQLERYEAIVETVSDGVFVVDLDGYVTFVNEALVDLSGYERDELVGAHISLIAGEDAIERGRQLEEQLQATEQRDAVLEADLERADGQRIPTETRFMPLPSGDEPPVRVGVVRDISDWKRHERHLEELNRLNDLIREITRTMVQTGSRERIEELVCERLMESERHAFAWIGTVDTGTGAITPREWYRREGSTADLARDLAELDGGDTPGPVTEAARSGSMQVVPDLDTVDAPWSELAASHGLRTAIAIPFVSHGVRYGVLSLYSTDRGAFDEDHREVLAQLREVVGHVINAIEREAVLLSDRVVEFTLRSKQAAEPFGRMADAGWPVTIERVVSTNGDTSLLYLAVQRGVRDDRVEAVLGDAPTIEGCRLVRERGDELLFEARARSVPLLPELASYGAYVRNATLADGVLTVVAELSPTHDVREVYEAIRDGYPDLEFVSQQVTEHEDRTDVGFRDHVERRLTAQQNRVLETAYYSGFFEWPRDRTGEEIADALDIAPSTFHKHLRLGEQKVMASIFDV